MEPWRVAGRSVPCGFGYTSLAPVCWAEPLTWSALPRSLWRSREEHERDWLGLWTGGSASLSRSLCMLGGGRIGYRSAEQKPGGSKARRLDCFT